MVNKKAYFIENLRKNKDLSQAYVAKEIGISRPSYIAIEQGKRELSLQEAERLTRVFHITLEELSRGEQFKVEHLPKVKTKEPSKKETNERISVPKQNIEKFKQTLLYILAKIGGKPNIGQTALYKLLYFIDFDYYEKYEEQLIGARYIKNTYGPTPVAFAQIIKQLEDARKVETVKSKFYKHEQTKYLVNPSISPDVSALSSQELAHIDWEISRLGDMTASQISALSHIDTPWRVAKERETLRYEHAFYRPKETSVRDYEPL